MRKIVFFSILLAIGAIACTKEGPMGPQGPAGADGNANVKSRIFSNQAFFFNSAANVYVVFLDWDGVTEEIVEKGTIQVWIGEANGNATSWTALPGAYSPNLVNAVNFDVAKLKGRVVVYSQTDPGFAADFKVVAIAGD